MEILNLGNSREMFWDDYLVDRSLSDTVAKVNPVGDPQTLLWIDESVISYPCICKYKDTYFLYYICGTCDSPQDEAEYWHVGVKLLTSTDGINWTKPEISVKGDNTVIEKVTDNFFVFLDNNPDCLPEEIFKGIGVGTYYDGKVGLYLFTSADGYNFKLFRLITNKGTFDSCNTMHYIDGRYVCYTRTWHPYKAPANRTKNMMNDFFDIPTPNENACLMRSISVLYSDDCINWSDPVELEYTDDLDHQMYTNNAMVYERAPHIMIGFPTRYCERTKWTENYSQLGGYARRWKSYNSPNPRQALAITDCLFMFSRDTRVWTRYNEAFMMSGYETDYNWVYGDNYLAFGLIDSGSENYYMYSMDYHQEYNSPKPLNMYKVRKDGFACQKADSTERCLVTKPLIFSGRELHINFKTSAYGYIIVDVLDENGNSLSNKESFEVFGNNIDRKVLFEDGEDFSDYANKPVRLRFRMRDAELYSMKFE